MTARSLQLCDACILVTSHTGAKVVARVVTYGQTVGPNDVDLSPEAYDVVKDPSGARGMTWQLVTCPRTTMQYQWQTGANVYWTSLWVRGESSPVAKLEVKSANHPSFTALTRGTDGTFTDPGGFGAGAFTLRVTSIDGRVVTDTFPSFTPGSLSASSGTLD